MYEPLGQEIGGLVGEGLNIVGFDVDIEKSMEYGSKVGSLGYYGLDIYLGTKGTHNALKELNKAPWTRGVFRTVGVGNMEVQIIEGASKNSSLLMNIGKDTLGYYFNARGLYIDVIKEDEKESSVNEKDLKQKVEPILDGITGVTPVME